ncbi:MAG TPA: F0F1 ATP synthase subunit gamma [Steroidobacteraceae bacterium]
MTDTLAGLRHKLTSAHKLGSVVRAMKAVAATSIVQYEAAVTALADYARCVELGLSLCLQEEPATLAPAASPAVIRNRPVGVLIFGSDQGLVGRFNEIIVNFALQALQPLRGPKTVWIVGERVAPHLEAAGVAVRRRYALPGSVAAITSLVSEIQLEMEAYTADAPTAEVHIFHNRPISAAGYEPLTQRLLPLDDSWRRRLARIPWPRGRSAEMLGGAPLSFPALVHEHLFICLYKACAESLASENASRLEAMQRAERNIDDISAGLHRSLNRLRQSTIDAELFDVVAGFNALGGGSRSRT